MIGPQGSVARKDIYIALLTLLKTATGITNGSRKAISWDAIGKSQTPAIILDEPKEDYKYEAPNLPAKVKLSCFAYLIMTKVQGAEPFGAETLIPMDALDDALDAIDAALAPSDVKYPGKQTLGGKVFHCYVSGQVIKGDSGDSGKVIAEIPLEILVTT